MLRLPVFRKVVFFGGVGSRRFLSLGGGGGGRFLSSSSTGGGGGGDAARAASEAIHGETKPRSKAMQRSMRANARERGGGDAATAGSLVNTPDALPPALPNAPQQEPQSFGKVMISNAVMGFAMSVRH